jgi:hypothetical protein
MSDITVTFGPPCRFYADSQDDRTWHATEEEARKEAQRLLDDVRDNTDPDEGWDDEQVDSIAWGVELGGTQITKRGHHACTGCYLEYPDHDPGCTGTHPETFDYGLVDHDLTEHVVDQVVELLEAEPAIAKQVFTRMCVRPVGGVGSQPHFGPSPFEVAGVAPTGGSDVDDRHRYPTVPRQVVEQLRRLVERSVPEIIGVGQTKTEPPIDAGARVWLLNALDHALAQGGGR